MKAVAKHYFSHPSVWTYILIGLGVFLVSYHYRFLHHYYYVAFLPIVIAPFFEWFAHKYLLHAQIGNVIQLPIQEHPSANIGDTILVDYHQKKIEMEVMAISEDTLTVGYGIARKHEGLRKFMYALHYGHHEDPNDIQLIFAPISSVFVLFATLFGITWLLTWSLGIATVFLLGVIVYYLHYEWMHLGHHIPGYQHIFPWSNKLKTAHQLHHYKNEKYWWGITNNIGDKLLGTYKKHDEADRSETIHDINV
jgi:hypothetical protein